MSIANAYQNKKKDEEEEKKVVGQQQKQQQSADKPVGTTSIPKDNQGISGRTQKSAASSLRQEDKVTTTAKAPQKENSKTNIIRRNTITANKEEQKQNKKSSGTLRRETNRNTERKTHGYSSGSFDSRSQSHGGNTGTWGYNKEVDDARVRYSQSLRNKDNTLPGPDSLPSARDFRRSQMTENERMADIAKSTDMSQIQKQNKPQYRNGVRWGEDLTKNNTTPILHGRDLLGTNHDKLTDAEIQRGAEIMTPEIAQIWSSPEYKLDDDARKIAKAYAQKEMAKYKSGVGGVPTIKSEEDRQNYAQLNNLANKTSPVASFTQGFIDPFLRVATTARDLVQKPFANDKTSQINDNVDASMRNAMQNAEAQNPVLAGAGKLAGNAAAYGMTEPLVDAAAGAIGVTSTAGKFIVNQAVNLAQDGALDIAPLWNELSKRDDLTPDQKALEVAKAIGLDVGGNLVGAGIGAALGKIGKSAANATQDTVEQTVKNAIPDEQILKSATDIPYQNVDELLSAGKAANDPSLNGVLDFNTPYIGGTNKSLGVDNAMGNIKDNALKKLAEEGGANENLEELYMALARAADEENLTAYSKAMNDYTNATGGQFGRQLNRLDDAVNGRMPESITPDDYGYIADNIDTIEGGLNRIRNLEGLSELGNNHLDNAYKLLNQYEDAVRNGGNADVIAKNLNKALGNLDNQAKKIEGYDGVFSDWKGANTARGDLYTNTRRINDVNRPLTAEEQAVVDSFGYEPNYAKPANPKASSEIPNVEGTKAKTFDRGPEERLIDTEDVRERGYARSTRNNPDIPDEVAAEFVENPEVYNVLHNKDTKERAQSILDQGFDKAYADYKDLINKKDPAAIPLGYDLAKQMIDNGDSSGAAELIRDMSKSLTESGQFSQSAAITLMHNDPMTALRYAQKEIDKLNTEGAKKFKNWKNFELTDEEIKAFNNLNSGDKNGIQKLYAQIGARLGKDYPTTALEKILEARRIGMLFNVRTNVRNFGANVPTLGMRWASDRVDAVGQNIAHIIDPKFKVTQSLTGSGVAGRKLAKEVFDSDKVQSLLKGTSGKYQDSIKSGLVQDKQMYKGTPIEKWIDKMTGNGLQRLNEKAFGKKGVQSVAETLRNATYKALDLGDSPFVKENFIERLGSYIKAQGYKSIDDIPDEAIETAWESAMKATYKDESWAYKMIRDIKSGIGQAGKPGKVVSESLIPFVQAPGNIAARMVDYSPVGAANGIKNIISGAKNSSEKTVREGINQLAQGATGTLALGIGVALYNSGLITGAYSQDKDQKAHEKNNGFREYALHLGDHYYTIDWAQPAFQTIMNGVVFADAIKKSDEYDSDLLNYFGIEGSVAGKMSGIAKQAAKTSINSWFNASPLQSMQELLGGTYEDSSDIASKLWSVVGEDFAGSYVPASVNALTKSMDLTQRQTYDPSSKTASFVNQQKAKIPYLSSTLPVKYDTWGREIKTAETNSKAAFNRFLNPGEGTYEKKEPIDKEIDRLFNETGNNAVFPQVAPNKIDGNPLTAKQVSELQKSMGEQSYKAANKFMESDVYKEMTDTQKAEGYSDLFSTIKWASQLKLTDPEQYKKLQDGDAEALKEITGNGASMKKKYITEGIDAVIDDIAYGQKKTEIDTDGNGSVNQDEILNYINNGHQDEADKIWDKFKGNGKSELQKDENGVYTLVDSKGSVKYGTDSLDEETKTAISDLEEYGLTKSGMVDKYTKAQSLIPEITTKEFADTYKAMDTDGNQSIKQDELIGYLNDNKITSQKEAEKLWQAYGNDWKSVPTLTDGEWKTSKNKNNNKTQTTGNNDFDTMMKVKQKGREDAKKNKIMSNEDLPDAKEEQKPAASSNDGLNWELPNGYDLKNTKTYQRARDAGVSDAEFNAAWFAADTDGNGYMKKAEARNYANTKPEAERDKWFHILYKGR